MHQMMICMHLMEKTRCGRSDGHCKNKRWECIDSEYKHIGIAQKIYDAGNMEVRDIFLEYYLQWILETDFDYISGFIGECYDRNTGDVGCSYYQIVCAKEFKEYLSNPWNGICADAYVKEKLDDMEDSAVLFGSLG